MLDLLIFRHAQRIEYAHQTLRSEQTHQIVLQRDVETGLTRVSLTSGTATQLIVDTSCLMALGTDDLQSSCRPRVVIQLDICTTAGHIRGNGHGAVLSGKSHNLSLTLMEFRIQHFVRNALLTQKTA